jgi:hypothetical protein
MSEKVDPARLLANKTGGKINKFRQSVEAHHNEF